ncbi:MAG TPA: glutathione S-transferase [Burkholderiaceae bacterium]|nr:glutathione S-transferase [Burkholderiaceae bacterium]
MQLIGMLDSPYVRRVAISLQVLGLPFEHRSISVFRQVDQFKELNPVVKAPSLVCDDGTVLMDSTLILQYAEQLAAAARSLMPADAGQVQRALRVIGLALAACEKSVQIIYERHLRPQDKQHEPWITRVTGQLLAAYTALEQELPRTPLKTERGTINQPGITAAVAWYFTQAMLPQIVSSSAFPALQRHSAASEQLAEFRLAPHGMQTYPHRD